VPQAVASTYINYHTSYLTFLNVSLTDSICTRILVAVSLTINLNPSPWLIAIHDGLIFLIEISMAKERDDSTDPDINGEQY
jgi:hypothetical protein